MTDAPTSSAPSSTDASTLTLKRHPSTTSDAFSGSPHRAALASFSAGLIQATLLLPLNTIQTQMQARGRGLRVTFLSNFETGFIGGLRSLYRALGPTFVMLGARQGLKFGSGAALKQRLPLTWPELVRDAVAGSLAACTSTTLLYPLDTLKTRRQLGMPAPSLSQCYNGFLPAVSYSATGMALWVVSRNALERTLPEPAGAARYTKHFLCGAIAGFIVQVRTLLPRLCRSPAHACTSCMQAPLMHARQRLCRSPAHAPLTAADLMAAMAADVHLMATEHVCSPLITTGHDVQMPTFPFDTLKKRMQSAEVRRSALDEARLLLQEGGPMRFYRGFWLKCFFVSLNGAVFNTVFVGVRRALKDVND